MNSPNLWSRLFIYVCMILITFHPMNQIAATTSLTTEFSPLIGLEGCLENGIRFTFLPSQKTKGGALIKLSCFIPTEKEESFISLITQHALFYGTTKFNREEFAHKLNDLGLDIEADSYAHSEEKVKSFQFNLSDQQPEKVQELLELINQIVFHPTLNVENVERARSHLVSEMKQQNEENLSLECVTIEEIQQFHKQWYRPELMHIAFIGFEQPKEVLSIFSETWGSSIKENQEVLLAEITLSPKENRLKFLNRRIELPENNRIKVVDGKIWMNEPNWINKSENGKKLGTFFTFIGIGSVLISFSFGFPVAIIAAGMTSLGTGIYFLTCDYLKDPEFVELLRQKDLENGMAYAYQLRRAGITLTPYERRVLFLQEMIDQPQTLHNRPILLLADFYHLNDPVFSEMFTPEELNVLTRLKRDFIQQRNQYKFLKEMLEKELANAIAPYTVIRDSALKHAKEVYKQNYYVATKFSFEVSRDEKINDIEKAFERNDISIEEKEKLIQQAHDEYTSFISAPNFKLGLYSAEITLMQMQSDIQATYDHQVELSKQAIQYYQRIDYCNQGINALVNYFEDQLHGLLAAFPVYLSNVPDYINLTGS